MVEQLNKFMAKSWLKKIKTSRSFDLKVQLYLKILYSLKILLKSINWKVMKKYYYEKQNSCII